MEPLLVIETHNLDHYMAVRDARKAQGLPMGRDSTEGITHAMQGKKLLRNGEIYRVKKVLRHWLWGHYIALLIEDERGSGCLMFWENETCGHEIVLKGIEKNRVECKVL